MAKTPQRKQLLDGYRYDGFTAVEVRGVFGDSQARVIVLTRRSKKQSAAFVAESNRVGTTRRLGKCEIYPAEIGGCIWSWLFGGSRAETVAL